MNKYLLLRDNKESGPYTVEELISKGIKAYDLVWLEGKSAAWRYPSEIDELKQYAPVVEEQPFDRFYKKPQSTPVRPKTAEDKTTATSPTVSRHDLEESDLSRLDPDGWHEAKPGTSAPVSDRSIAEKTTQRPAVVKHVPALHETSKSSKIFVTLPVPQVTTSNSRDNRKPGSGSQVHPEFVPKVHDAGSISGSLTSKDALQNTVEPLIPSPVREVGATHGAEHPRENAENESQGSSRRRNLKRISPGSETAFGNAASPAAIDTVADHGILKQFKSTKLNSRLAVTILTGLCLLLGGVVIGLVISNSRSAASKELDAVVKRIQEREMASGRPAAYQEPAPLIPANAGAAESEVQAEEEIITNPEPVAKPATRLVSAADNKLTDTKALATTVENSVITEQSPEPRRAVVRESVTREPSATNRNAALKNIRSMLALEANEYKTGVLGGISGLELRITNNSPVDVDQVVAEIEYLGPEKRVVKTQTIIFNNIKAGQQKSQEVPRTNRGVSLTYTIKTVSARSPDVAATDL